MKTAGIYSERVIPVDRKHQIVEVSVNGKVTHYLAQFLTTSSQTSGFYFASYRKQGMVILFRSLRAANSHIHRSLHW